MAIGSIGRDNFVQLEPLQHKYFDFYKKEYKPVSRFLDLFHEKFDEETISYRVASSKLGTGASQEAIYKEQALIKADWAKTRDDAANYGTGIHNHLEKYFKTGVIEPKYLDIATKIGEFYGKYHRIYPEVCLYHREKYVAGTTDVVIERTPKTNIFDFYDYKTNIERGIEFCAKKKTGEYLNKYMFEPINHLEDCSYNKYALQLSIYAYMAEVEYGIKVGRLAILFIDRNLKLHVYPVNYMRMEVKAMFESYNPVEVVEAKQLELSINPENDW